VAAAAAAAAAGAGTAGSHGVDRSVVSERSSALAGVPDGICLTDLVRIDSENFSRPALRVCPVERLRGFSLFFIAPGAAPRRRFAPAVRRRRPWCSPVAAWRPWLAVAERAVRSNVSPAVMLHGPGSRDWVTGFCMMLVTGVFLLVLLVALMLAGAVPVQGGMQTVVFRTPLFILLMAALALMLMLACRRRGFALRRLPFWLVHGGVVVVLSGALLGYLLGEAGRLRAFAGADQEVRRVKLREGEWRDFGFGVRVVSFSVDYHARIYGLYEAVVPEDPEAPVAYRLTAEYTVMPDSILDLGEAGALAATALRDPDTGAWRRQHDLGNDRVLRCRHSAPRHYRARLRFSGPDGVVQEQILAVNAPVVFRGWRFVLTSYDAEAQRYVDLVVARDPGRLPALAGLWMVMSGTIVSCFGRASTAHGTD